MNSKEKPKSLINKQSCHNKGLKPSLDKNLVSKNVYDHNAMDVHLIITDNAYKIKKLFILKFD